MAGMICRDLAYIKVVKKIMIHGNGNPKHVNRKKDGPYIRDLDHGKPCRDIDASSIT